MWNRIAAAGAALVLVTGGQAQNKPAAEPTGARELFYFAVASKDKLPPITKAAATKPAVVPTNITPTLTASSTQPSPVTTAAGAVHLGMKYTLALVNSANGESQPVDSDRNFKNGECVAIDFESNRSGYLYVLAKQSSGDWLPLLPSNEMPNETNVINPGERTRVPKEYCFEVHNPPGTEKLFVVLSRDPQDIYQLNEGIKGNGKPGPQSGAPGAAPPTLVADAGIVNKEVQRMTQQFGTRDLIFRKVSQPVSSKEQAHSVYVVNGSDKPATHISLEINIQHH